MRRIVLVFGVAVAIATAQLHAQEQRARPSASPRQGSSGLTVVITGGASWPQSDGFDQSTTTTINAETAAINADQSTSLSTFVEGGLRARLGTRFTVGALAFFSRANAAAHVVAAVPHPFYFNAPREVAGNASDLAHREYGAHVELGYPLSIASRRILVFGGPSWFRVERALITGVDYTDSYPYDTAAFAGATSATGTGTAPGFNAGVETAWPIARSSTFAVLARYAHANVKVSTADDDTAEVKAGGLEVGAGLRFVF